MCVCVCMHAMCARAYGDQKCLGPSGTGVMETVSHPVSVLGTECGPSGKQEAFLTTEPSL